MKNWKYCQDEDTFYDVEKKYGYNISELRNGTIVYHCVSCGFLPKNLVKLTKEQKEIIENSYEADVVSCEECGAMFNSDDLSYPNAEFRIVGCSCMCDNCITDEDLMVRIEEPRDIYKAQNINGIEESGLYKEIKTLFVDSSGLGRSYEAAMTTPMAEKEVSELLEKHGELFCALTDVGQFQVYVGIFKKLKKRSCKK